MKIQFSLRESGHDEGWFLRETEGGELANEMEKCGEACATFPTAEQSALKRKQNKRKERLMLPQPQYK